MAEVSAADMPVATKTRKYEIRALGVNEFPQWDEFVRQSPQGTLFHSTLWLEAAGVPFRVVGCLRNGEMHGGLATGLVGHRSAGNPEPGLTPYLGLLYPRTDAKYVSQLSKNKEIARLFAAYLKSEFEQIDLTFSPEINDLQPFIWEGFVAQVRYTYRLSLRSLDEVLDKMDSSRRNKLNSAERQGVRVESGADFAEIMALRDRSFERQGLPLNSRAAGMRFEAALRRAKRCEGFLARSRGGDPLGAAWIAWDEKRAYYLIGGYDDAANSTSAVSFALWRAIQFTATDLKLPEFDFEGSMLPAVEQFFRKFGGVLTPYYWVRYAKPRRPSVARRLAKWILGERLSRRVAHTIRGR